MFDIINAIEFNTEKLNYARAALDAHQRDVHFITGGVYIPDKIEYAIAELEDVIQSFEKLIMGDDAIEVEKKEEEEETDTE